MRDPGRMIDPVAGGKAIGPDLGVSCYSERGFAIPNGVSNPCLHLEREAGVFRELRRRVGKGC